MSTVDVKSEWSGEEQRRKIRKKDLHVDWIGFSTNIEAVHQ